MPSNRMSRFEIFVGTWNTTGEVLALDDSPPSTLVATDSYRWLPGKHFMLHDVDARFGEDAARSMEVVGYDLASKSYFAHSYDDQGASEAFKVDLDGKRWRIVGDTMRFDGKFSAGGSKLVGLWERKSKKGRWRPWIKLQLTRT